MQDDLLLVIMLRRLSDGTAGLSVHARPDQSPVIVQAMTRRVGVALQDERIGESVLVGMSMAALSDNPPTMRSWRRFVRKLRVR